MSSETWESEWGVYWPPTGGFLGMCKHAWDDESTATRAAAEIGAPAVAMRRSALGRGPASPEGAA